jgi:pyridoxine 5-phosphate synthase
LALHAGHGLNYRNVAGVARIDGMAELNIGHSIVSRAVFSGLRQAVADMRVAIVEALG